MTRASHNYGEALIYVLPIVGLQIIKEGQVFEVVVGSELSLPLSMWGEANRRFTKCHQVEIKTLLADKSVAMDIGAPLEKNPAAENLVDNACTNLNLLGLSMGFTKVTVSHQYTTLEGKAVKVSDFVTVAVLDPLAPIQPESGTTILSVGSSLDIVFKGGPGPWIHSPESHFHNVKVQDESLIELQERKSSTIPGNFYVYNVVCNKVGETKVELQVGNGGSITLPQPLVLTSSVTVICAEPDRLQLEASPTRPEGLTCPLIARTGRISALCYEDLKINVSVFDSMGRKMDNYSSSDISWSNSDEAISELKQEKGVIFDENASNLFYKPISGAQGHQILLTKDLPGSLEITGTLKKSSYLMGRSTSDTIELQLVNDAEISPVKVGLFNHEANSANFRIAHGSGYFDVTSSEAGIANHKFTASNRSVLVTPLMEGSTGLKVRDLCLTSRSLSKSKATVNVIGIHKVELKVVDQIQLGTEAKARVEIKDQFGDMIDISSISDQHLKIVVKADSKDIAVIEPNGKDTFVVHGSKLGHTTLIATATYGSRQINSNPTPLNVFQPLELEPRNITLIIGAQFQVQVFGGPEQLDSTIEFSIGNNKIAGLDTSSLGLITALTLGSTRVTAKAVRSSSNNNGKIEFSKDTIDVHVVKLHGVKIKAPITKLKVGSVMPLSMVGLDKKNQQAFAYGSAQPYLSLGWKLTNQEVGTLESPFACNGIGINDKNNGAMRFVAKKAGRTTIKLKAKITQPIDILGQNQLEKDQDFTDYLEIVVIEDLKGKSPYIGKNSLILSPFSKHQLKTNRDGITKVSFTLMPNSDGNEIISLSKSGKISAKNLLGTSIILVKTIEENAIVQEMSIVVQVKPISYLMLNPKPVMNLLKPVLSWPLGLKLPLEVSYHDEAGVAFDSVHDPDHVLSTRPNRFDTNLVRNANNSLSIQLIQEGMTVLKTSLGPSLSDFLVFDVASGIKPNPKLIGVGDVLVLQSLIQGNAKKGQWISEPKGILSLDAEKGLAVAERSGMARISYLLDQDLQLIHDLEVVKSSKIEIVKTPEQVLTNQLGKVQAVKFNVVSEALKESNVIGDSKAIQDEKMQHLFTCQARFAQTKNVKNLFKIETGFQDGHYACLFTALDDSLAIPDEVDISVVPSASSLMQVQGDTIRLAFMPVFKVLSSSSTIQLTNVEPQMELIVSGQAPVLDSISINLNEPHFMFVGRSYAKSDDTRAWPIGLKSGFWTENVKPGTELKVSVVSPMTEQEVEMPVQVTFRGDQCANIELGWSSLLYFLAGHYQSVLFIVASCVVCVFITRLIVTQASAASANAKKDSNGNKPVVNGNASKLLSTPLMNRSPTTFVTSDSKPYLWTTNDSPVYGSPTANVSPYGRKSPRPLSQYSYN